MHLSDRYMSVIWEPIIIIFIKKSEWNISLQLSGLQFRLHHALVRYYHIRGLFNKNELMRFDEMSAENAHRIQTLQGDMDNAIDTISHFLTDQLDGTAASMVHAAATAAMMKDDSVLGVTA